MSARTEAGGAQDAPLHFVDPRQFKANTRVAVDDAHLRQSFRSAMDFLQAKRAAHFGDAEAFDALRHVGEAIRQYSLARLPDLLEQLEGTLTRAGVVVHWAATPAEANAIFLALAREHGAKGRSKRQTSRPAKAASSAGCSGLRAPIATRRQARASSAARTAPGQVAVPACSTSARQPCAARSNSGSSTDGSMRSPRLPRP